MAASGGKASLAEVRRTLRSMADPARARFYRRFLKTGPGDNGEETVS